MITHLELRLGEGLQHGGGDDRVEAADKGLRLRSNTVYGVVLAHLGGKEGKK